MQYKIELSVSNSLFLVLVHLLFVLPAPGLAIRTVPIEQDNERDEEEAVGYGDGGHHAAHGLVETILLENDPRVKLKIKKKN